MEQASQLSCQLSELLKRRESGHEITFSDYVDQFNFSEGGCRCFKRFETQHRPDPTFDEPVILFNDVIEVFLLHHLEWYLATEAIQHYVYGFDTGCVGPAFVDENLLRQSVRFERSDEGFRHSSFFSALRSQEVQGLAVPAYGAIEGNPLTLRFHIGLIHAP